MTTGNLICLGLIGLQLGAQIGSALCECFRKPRAPDAPRCPPISTHARRDYLDRKSEIERDARRRL
jgi:hypothetical protein